tara:strand:- start:9886 stop:10530 length:645 start_codon:yes stop_codon:yes gene_type:complete
MNYQHMIHNHQNLWDAYTKHPLIQQLLAQALSPAIFKSYLMQSMIPIKKSSVLLSELKSKTHDPIQRYAIEQYQEVFNLELTCHQDYLATQGFTTDDLTRVAWEEDTRAYCDFLEEESQSLNIIDFFMALSPSVIGYAEVGQRAKQGFVTAHHVYGSWLDLYQHDAYQLQASKIEAILTKELICLSSQIQPLNRMVHKFKRACQLEVGLCEQSF